MSAACLGMNNMNEWVGEGFAKARQPMLTQKTEKKSWGRMFARAAVEVAKTFFYNPGKVIGVTAAFALAKADVILPKVQAAMVLSQDAASMFVGMTACMAAVTVGGMMAAMSLRAADIRLTNG